MRRIVTGFFLLILAGATGTPMEAGVNSWTPSGPWGPWITAVAIDPVDESAVYIGTAGAGLFRSQAGGEWEPKGAAIEHPVVTVLATGDASDSALYAVAGDYAVFESTDRGTSWRRVWSVSRYEGRIVGIAFDPAERRLYARTLHGYLFTVDVVTGRSGRYFRLSGGALPQGVAAIRGAAFAANANGILVTRDGGLSWTTRNYPQPVSRVASHLENPTVYAANENVVFSSSDAGETWQPLPSLDAPVTALHVTRSEVYAAAGRYVLRFDGASGTWVARGGIDAISGLAVADASPVAKLYAVTGAGLFTSAEDGTWEASGGGPVHLPFIEDLSAVGEDVAYAATSAGTFRTADGGRTWSRVAAVDGPAQSVVAAADSVYVAGINGIHASADNGETWDLVAPKVAEQLATTRTAPDIVYAYLGDRLEKSSDGGRTWQDLTLSLPWFGWYLFYGIGGLEADPNNPATAYVSFDGGLSKTVDGGKTWSVTRGYVPTFAVHGSLIHAAASDGVSSRSGIVTSHNGGATWSSLRLEGPGITAIVIHPHLPAIAYAAARTGEVYRTTNGGEEWGLFSEERLPVPVGRLGISASGRRLYAATPSGVYIYNGGSVFPFEELPADLQRLPNLVESIRSAPEREGGAAAGIVLSAVGTVHASGGSTFRTDVTLSNGRPVPQDAVVAWLPLGNSNGPAVPMFRVTLPRAEEDGSGGAVTIRDLAEQLGLEGLGALVVLAVDSTGAADPDGSLDGFARIRTSASCGTGSMSQSFGALPLRTQPGNRARALGLRHDQEHRTNIGIVNLEGVSREFTVVATGERTTARMTVAIPPFAPLQMPLPDRDYGSLNVTVTGDGNERRWVGYGSTVDNGSRDAWSSLMASFP